MEISKDEMKKISDAVNEAERKTSGEIAPVILSKSDNYPASHFRLAILLGVLAAILCYYFYDFIDPIALIWVQVPGMFLGYLLAFIPALKKLFTTKAEMQEEVRQRALEIFYENHVSHTENRTGIMIFVSLLEHRIEIIGDNGINAKVPSSFWSDLVKQLSTDIKAGMFTEGMIKAVMTCGKELEQDFPLTKENQNQLSNKLITDLH